MFHFLGQHFYNMFLFQLFISEGKKIVCKLSILKVKTFLKLFVEVLVK